MSSSSPAGLPTGWPAGVTEAEAARRVGLGQANTASLRGSVSVARILRRNLVTILNGSLAAVSVILLLVGRPGDALVTCAPVFLNAAVGVIGELDAKRRLDRITLAARAPVTLLRDGQELRLMPEDVVLGDIVVFARGDQAVVDGTVVAGSVEADESILTGEAEAIPKGPLDEIRSGTICLAGRAAVEVTGVGEETFASRLAAEARRDSDERTPLRRDLNALVVTLGLLTILTAIPVSIALARQGLNLFSPEAAQIAAVLVAMVPQGLLVMTTITYGYAAVRISRAGAIVQRIDAVESMSRVDTLCLDKTGTITSSRLELESVHVLTGDEAEVRARIADLAASGAARDRTVDAIAAALGGSARPVVDEVSFSSARRWSAVVLADDPSRAWFLGAPEALGVPAGEHGGADPGSQWPDATAAVAAEVAAGCRCLVFAEGQATLRRAAIADSGSDLDAGDTPHLPVTRPVAVLGLREQLRPDARETLAALRAAGLELKLVSGDAPATVAGIGESAGVPVTATVAGSELVGIDDAALRRVAAATNVFGRIEPEVKRRLVRALRADGHYVAMTGDGVNDVLALREAHLGIAMESGSPAARAVAGLVLLGDRFAVLPRAIVEGQRVVSAMIAVASVLVARTISIMLIVLASAVLSLPFPLTPKLNSVLALVTVGIPTIVLALWVPPKRSPRQVAWTMAGHAIPSGIAVALLAIPVMVGAFGRLPLDEARVAVTTLSIFAGTGLLPILFPVEPDRAGPFGRGGDPRPTLLAIAMLGFFVVLGLVPVSREFFELTPLPPELVAILAVYAAAWMLAVIAVLRTGWPQRLVHAVLDRVGSDRGT
jgi:cation-transporting ATPase E